jgi:hypothetical protein
MEEEFSCLLPTSRIADRPSSVIRTMGGATYWLLLVHHFSGISVNLDRS